LPPPDFAANGLKGFMSTSSIRGTRRTRAFLAFGLAIAVGSFGSAPPLFAQAAAPTTAASDVAGLLNIHVTAVQGGAQFRPNSDSKWQSVTAGLDVPEGVEFRTGPKGEIQFTVGTDQVYRVDRLTVLKVLRANLNSDGTIQTDVGMTYGRVSKDVDLPQHPHQDTIISPSSTLAVRGTHVGYYDQPPYDPEATSLTGQAYFRNLHGELVAFGGKGTGFAKVNGDSQSAGDFQLNSNLIDPNGAFSGHTSTELQSILTSLGSLQGTQLGVFQSLDSTTGAPPATSIVGALPLPGILYFAMVWNSTTDNTMVDYTATSPLHDGTVSFTNQTVPSGGSYAVGLNFGNPEAGGYSRVAVAPENFSQQLIEWGTSTLKFPVGTYTITTTLLGTSTQPLSQVPTATANVQVLFTQTPPAATSSGATNITGNAVPVVLSASNPKEQFQISAPFANNANIVEINSAGKRTTVNPMSGSTATGGFGSSGGI
jgi:hypothetical protein